LRKKEKSKTVFFSKRRLDLASLQVQKSKVIMKSSILDEIERYFSTISGWPSWAIRLIGALSVLVILTAVVQQYVLSKELTKHKHSTHSAAEKKISLSFRLFQVKYLSVYLITMLADWLQGTNMYTLYTVNQFNAFSLFCLFFCI
jgi:hypothetical protein